jgi:hypothetical protein
MSKKQNRTKFFAKNKSFESTDHETGVPNAASQEVSIENTDEGSKAESLNSKMRRLAINTELLLAFYKSNSRVFWSQCRALHM